MPKSVLFRTVSLTILFLFVLVALPLHVSADQAEDVTESVQQLQPTTGNAAEQSPSPWKRFLTAIGLQDGTSAPSEKSEPSVETSAIKPVEIQEPVAAPEKPVIEKIDSTIVEEKRTATENSGGEKVPENIVRQTIVTPPIVQTPVQKPAEASKSSTWQSFLAFVGLHDDRQSIPPLEVKSSQPLPGQDYIIGPGDVLGISVWRDDSLTRSVVVLPDGKIQFPLIGEVVAGGKSVAQLKKEFVEKLSSYVVDADISVEVKQSNSLFVYIIGKVNSPGRQLLVADTTVLQALAMAGGLNPFAEKEDIKVVRQEKDRTLVYSFRYSQVVSGTHLDDNLLLKRGDVIVVP